jgi:hypothetical protein
MDVKGFENTLDDVLCFKNIIGGIML